MATIINSPPSQDNNAYGAFFVIFALVIVGIIFVYFGIPALRQMGTPQINVPAPVINMPGEVDVNVQQTP
jgi:hypothetical protein